jgi:hypothetical protein
MNRYEEILTRMVAAHIAAGSDPLVTAVSHRMRRAAEAMEEHFKEREGINLGKMMAIEEMPALLRPQAG